MANKEVQIIVSAKDLATQTFKRLEIATAGATRQLDRLGTSLQRNGRLMTTALTLPLGLAAAKALKLASDAEETANKFNVSFGDMADTARNFTNQLANDLGRSSLQMQNFAASAQAILAPMVQNREVAASMSLALSALAVDLGSFMNMADQEAFDRLISGMLGSTEATERLGISLRESRLQMEAERIGLKGRVASMDDATKIQLRFLAALRQTTDAQGDAIRTQNSFANQTKVLQANLTDLGISIGQELLPYGLAAVSWASDLTEEFKKLSPETREAMLKVAGLVAVAGPLSLAIGTLVRGVSLLGKGFVLLSRAISKHPYLTAAVFLASAALAIDQVREKVEELLRTIGLGGLLDTLGGAAEGFKQLGEAADNIVFDPDAAMAEADAKVKEWIENIGLQIEENLKNSAARTGEDTAKELADGLDRGLKLYVQNIGKDFGIKTDIGDNIIESLGLNNLDQKAVLDAVNRFNEAWKDADIQLFDLDKLLGTNSTLDVLQQKLEAQKKLLIELVKQGLDPASEAYRVLAEAIKTTNAQLQAQTQEAEVNKIRQTWLSNTAGYDSPVKIVNPHSDTAFQEAIAKAQGQQFDLLEAQIQATLSALDAYQRAGLGITDPQVIEALAKLEEYSKKQAEIAEKDPAVRDQRIRELIDAVELFNDDAARQMQEVVNYLNVLPTIADTLATGFEELRASLSETFGGGFWGKFLGSLATGYAAWNAFGTGSGGTTSLVGTAGAIGVMLGASWGAPLLAASGLVNTLFPGKPKSEEDKALQDRINKMNKMLREWGASYQSENLWFKKDSGLFNWRNLFGNQIWTTMNKEAALEGSKIAEQLIQSMTTTFDQLGQGLGEVLFNAGNFEDFGKFVGRRLQQVLLESMLQAEAIKGPLQKLSAFMAEAVMDGLTDAEIQQVKNLAEAVFEGMAGFSDVAKEIAEQFGLAEEAANGIAGALRNVPSGFKIALTEFTSAQGIPAMASGGYVPYRPGGTIVRLAEAGEGEWVIPERRLARTSTGGDTYIFNIGDVYGVDDLDNKIASAMDRVLSRRSLARYGLRGGGR